MKTEPEYHMQLRKYFYYYLECLLTSINDLRLSLAWIWTITIFEAVFSRGKIVKNNFSISTWREIRLQRPLGLPTRKSLSNTCKEEKRGDS